MIKRNQWYKLNEKEFTDILRFVGQDIANNPKYIESLNRVGDAFTNNKVLYLKLSRESSRQQLSWHYRTSYSEFFSGPCLEYKDIMFDIVNGAKTGKRTFITEDWSGTKYELKLGTWYEVNLREYSAIINSLPTEIRRDLFDEEIEYGLKAAKNRTQIYIMFDYYREVDDEHCTLNVSKNAPKEYAKLVELTKVSNNSLDDIILRSGDLIHWGDDTGAYSSTIHDSDGKRIKDSVFANDDIIKIVRDGKVIYDREGYDKLTAEQIRKRAEKLIMNSVYGARRFPTMDNTIICGTRYNSDELFNAMLHTNKENKEEKKVMEENKIQAIKSIIDRYEDDAARELNRQYGEQEKEVKAKDPNIIALKQYVEVLNKNRRENTEPYNVNGFNEIYTAETQMQLDKLYGTLMDKKQALHDQCIEVRSLCILCDTYEQMRQVLADYEIIPNTKKRGK